MLTKIAILHIGYIEFERLLKLWWFPFACQIKKHIFECYVANFRKCFYRTFYTVKDKYIVAIICSFDLISMGSVKSNPKLFELVPYRMCSQRNASVFILKRLHVAARSDILCYMERRYGLAMYRKSVCSEQWLRQYRWVCEPRVKHHITTRIFLPKMRAPKKFVPAWQTVKAIYHVLEKLRKWSPVRKRRSPLQGCSIMTMFPGTQLCACVNRWHHP